MGVYQAPAGRNALFLAIDLDDASWSDDVLAFAQTCAAAEMPAVVERSPSSDIAYAWLSLATGAGDCSRWSVILLDLGIGRV